MDINKCYDTLGLTEDASFEQVHKRFIELSKKYHPDSNFNSSEEDKLHCQEKFKEINEAYQAIKRSLEDKDIAFKENKNLNTKDIGKVYYIKGMAFYNEGDINNALDCFFNAYRKDENNPIYIRNIVKCLLEKPEGFMKQKNTA